MRTFKSKRVSKENEKESFNKMKDVKNTNELLIEAIFYNDVNEIKSILKKNPNLTYQEDTKKTLLLYAAEEGNLEIIKMLLENDTEKVSINVENEAGETPILLAVSKSYEAPERYLKVIKYLYEEGANLDFIGRDFKNIKEKAKERGIFIITNYVNKIYEKDKKRKIKENIFKWVDEENLKLFKKSLKYGANVNKYHDKKDMNLIMFACKKNNLNMVNILLENGADIEFENNNNENVLTIASKNGNVKLMENLIKKLRKKKSMEEIMNHKTIELETIIMNAVRSQSTDAVKCVLNKYDNREEQNEKGITALMIAAKSNNVEIMNLLLNYNVTKTLDINGIDYEGYTALMIAAFYNNFEAVKYLIDEGANLFIKNNYNEDVFDIVEKYNGYEKIKEILKPFK